MDKSNFIWYDRLQCADLGNNRTGLYTGMIAAQRLNVLRADCGFAALR